jgi:hypothetical protein
MAMTPSKRLAVDHSDDNQQRSLAPASTSTSTTITNDLPERHDLKQNGWSVLEKIKTAACPAGLRPRIGG